MDRYEKVKILGRGVFGCAYLMRRRDDGEPVVIKQVLVGSMDEAEREKARMECEVLGKLSHENIVALFDHFICEQGMLNIVMEYADGGTLADVVAEQRRRKQPLTEDEVLDLVAMVALALEHTHAKRLLHRDLKAANVFLDRDRVVKLGDFGLARALSDSELAQTAVGTPYYLSPELIQGKGYDDKSDVWALGVLFYELAALEYPFQGANLAALMHAILNTEAAPFGPPRFSEEAWRLCTALLRRDPAERPTAAGVLQEPLLAERLPRLRARLARLRAERRSRPAPPSPLADSRPEGAGGASEVHPLAGRLPEEVLLAVLGRLEWRDLVRVGLVDRTLRRLATAPALWRPLCLRTFNLPEGTLPAPRGARDDGASWRSLFLELARAQVWLWGDGCSNPRARDELYERGVAGLAFGRRHRAAVTHTGEVLTWGEAGDGGQLGHGGLAACKRPTLVRALAAAKVFVLQVAAGDLYTLARDAGGAVWGWGTNEEGVLGFDPALAGPEPGDAQEREEGEEEDEEEEDDANVVPAPKRIAALAGRTVVHLAAGPTHACAITEGGEALTWGATGEGRLGHPRPGPHVPDELLAEAVGRSCWQPRAARLPADDPAASATCGADFTVFLTRSGKVYAAGANHHGQLGAGAPGAGAPVERWEPGPVRGVEARVTQVAAGAGHALALCETGWVYSWGLNDCGQLGRGTSAPQKRPSLSGSAPRARAAAPEGGPASPGAEAPRGKLQAAWDDFAAKRAPAARKAEGEGAGPEVPRVVRELLGKGVASVAAGAAHSLAVTEFGEVFSWGQNEHGQLGDESRGEAAESSRQWHVPRLVPALAENRRVRAAAGYTASAALLGRELPWQRAPDGALALRR